jgi:hypothetical protein
LSPSHSLLYHTTSHHTIPHHTTLHHTTPHHNTPYHTTQQHNTPHHLAQVTIQRYEREKADEEPCLLAADIAVDSKDTDENITTPIMMYVLSFPFHCFRDSPYPYHISPIQSTPLFSSPYNSTLLFFSPLNFTHLFSTPLFSTLHSSLLLTTPLLSSPHHSTPLYSSPLSALRNIHPEWNINPSDEMIGMTYDGRAALYTTEKLDFYTVPNTCKVPSRGQSVRPTTVARSVVWYGMVWCSVV